MIAWLVMCNFSVCRLFTPRGAPALLWVDGFGCTALVDLRQGRRQDVELLLPVLGIAIQPHGGIEERTHIEAAAADASTALLLHQSGAHQNLDVTRDALECDVEGVRKLGHEQRRAADPLQYSAPDGITHSLEYKVEPRIVAARRIATA